MNTKYTFSFYFYEDDDEDDDERDKISTNRWGRRTVSTRDGGRACDTLHDALVGVTKRERQT